MVNLKPFAGENILEGPYFFSLNSKTYPFPCVPFSSFSDDSFYKQFWKLQIYFHDPDRLFQTSQDMTQFQIAIVETLSRFEINLPFLQPSLDKPSSRHTKSKSSSKSSSSSTMAQAKALKLEEQKLGKSLEVPLFPRFLTSPEVFEAQVSVHPIFLL